MFVFLKTNSCLYLDLQKIHEISEFENLLPKLAI